MEPENCRTPTGWTRNLSLLTLAVVPAMYVLGFLGWSIHAKQYGLGFLPLSLVQYLVPGAVMLAMMAVSLASYYFLRVVFQPKIEKSAAEGRFLRPALAHANLLGLSLMIGGSSIFYLRVIFPVFSFSAVEQPFLFILGLMLALYAGACLVFLLAIYYMRVVDKSIKIHKRDQVASPSRPAESHPWKEGDAKIPAIITIISVAFLVFSLLMFPHLSSEFGGGEIRTATFDLDHREVSTATLARLWPDWNVTGQEDIVRTPKATVLFVNEDFVLVRPATEDNRTGALFELSRSSVKTIIWSSR